MDYKPVRQEILNEINDAESECEDVEIIIPNPDDGIITDTKEDLIRIEKNGIMRNIKTGKFVKGSKPPRGFKHKVAKLDKIILKRCGPDANGLVEKLLNIAMYDPEKLVKVTDKKTGEIDYKPKAFHFYNSNTQLQALTLLMKYYFGNPRKEIQIDQSVDIKIEKKVADITKLINDNQEKLKIVKEKDKNNG